MGIYRDIFLLASKVGCLEGYTYRRHDLDYRSLPNWIGNIASMINGLTEDAVKEIRDDMVIILRNVKKNFSEDDALNRECADMFQKALDSLFKKLEEVES